MKSISTTKKIENRLKELRKEIKHRYFKADAIDIIKDFNKFQEKDKVYYEGGYSRIIDSDKFFQSQVKKLKIELDNSNFKENRIITEIPDNFNNKDKLRTAIIDIQYQAGANKLFIPVSRKETADKIKDFISNLKYEKEIILVLDMSMEYEELYPLLNWSITKHSEVVLLYRDWYENKTNFSLAIRLSEKFPNKLHMALVPCSINKKGIISMIGSVLIAKEFKSVSFTEPTIPTYVFVNMKNKKPKTEKEELDYVVWANENTMTYDDKHRDNCCISNEEMKKIIHKYGVKTGVTYHNLEVLSKKYEEIKQKEEIKNKVLELESIKEILELINK